MKRITSIILLLFLLCGCSAGADINGAESHAQITVNLPSDNTVNGYRTENSKSSEMPDTVSSEDVKPAESSDENITDLSTAYIGNANSHIFHNSDCSSANTMKEENKIFFKSREEAVNGGYTPCKRCNP